MIFCKELNKSFNTNDELIAELVANKQVVLDAKKSVIVTHKTCSFLEVVSGEADKVDGEQVAIGYGSKIAPIINTTNYMDSHRDVHARNIWNKSAKEQNGKVYYVVNHDLGVGSVISMPKDVEVKVISKSWKSLGKDYPGTTNALVFETVIHDYANESFVKYLKSGVPLQNSIRMRYIDVALCVMNPQYEDENKNWKKYIDEVANREFAEEVGYFYYVKEAGIHLEGSAVLFGSNDATPIQTSKNIEPSGDTQTNNKSEQVKMPVWLNLM